MDFKIEVEPVAGPRYGECARARLCAPGIRNTHAAAHTARAGAPRADMIISLALQKKGVLRSLDDELALGAYGLDADEPPRPLEFRLLLGLVLAGGQAVVEGEGVVRRVRVGRVGVRVDVVGLVGLPEGVGRVRRVHHPGKHARF